MNLMTNGHLQLEALAQIAKKPPLFEPDQVRFWDDPYIAQQMLKTHLDPNTDMASRKPETIERSVEWITKRLGLSSGARVLDLGCGPGLYARLFAAHGLNVTGLDCSENSLRYAREHDPASTYVHGDYVRLDLTTLGCFDAAVLIYGDLCVLSDVERDTVIKNVFQALKPGGYFVFDVMTPKNANYSGGMHWSVEIDSGFWKPSPHIALLQKYLYPNHDTLLEQYIVIEASGEMTEYRIWTHHYTLDVIKQVMLKHGFEIAEVTNDLMGSPYQPDAEWMGIVGHKI